MNPSQEVWLLAMAIRLLRLGLEMFRLFRDIWDAMMENRYSKILRKAKRRILAILRSPQRHLVFRNQNIYQKVRGPSEVVDDALQELCAMRITHQLHGGWTYGPEPIWH